jgi:hypothetical protein
MYWLTVTLTLGVTLAEFMAQVCSVPEIDWARVWIYPLVQSAQELEEILHKHKRVIVDLPCILYYIDTG